VNAVVLGFFHTPVSHMSGAVSHLGLDLAEGRAGATGMSLGIILGFVLGALAAGLLVGAHQPLPARRYGAALVVEGLLLAGATFWLVRRAPAGLPLVAAACGLQNGLSSTYCGLALRTTHVTGLVTDLGLMLGQALRHRRVDTARLGVCAALFAAFGVGGGLGAWLDLRHGPAALWPVAAGVSVAGAVYWRWAARRR
jgi:uncharacterized membrane protein YoaK (UPF0700 family)